MALDREVRALVQSFSNYENERKTAPHKIYRTDKLLLSGFWIPEWKFGGANRDRTDDLNAASVALSQLSYSPTIGRRRAF
jgi:hypothetical protein